MHLQPRRELWEYGFIPLHAVWPQLDAQSSVLQTHAKLLTLASCTPNGEWSIAPWDMGSIMELTITQQEIVCEVLGAVSVLNGTPPNRPAPGSELVYVHELSLLIFVLLFSKESQSQRAENNEVWPEAGPLPIPTSFAIDGLTSPTRAMTIRTSLSGKASMRQQLQQHFRHQTQQLRGLGEYLRRHVKTLVELCLDPAPSPPSTAAAPTISGQDGADAGGAVVGGHTASALSQQNSANQQSQFSPQRLVSTREVDRLRFVLTPSTSRNGGSISGMLPVFGMPGSKAPLDVVVQAIRQLWFEDVLQSPRVGSYSPAGSVALMSPMASSKPVRHFGMVAPSGQVDDCSINGVQKGTVVRGESDLPQGTLRVADCHDAVIYALAPLQTVYISSCSETTIVIGAAGQLIRVERCEKITLIAAAARVIVSSCHDCLLHLGTPRPPLLIGDCRFVRLAPYNTRYEKQLAHVAAVGLRLDCPNRWDSPLVLVPRERRLGSTSSGGGGAGGTPDSPRASGGSTGSGTGLSTSRGLLATTFSLLQPDDLLPFVIPFQGSSGLLAGGPAPSHATSWKQMVTASQHQRSSTGGRAPDTSFNSTAARSPQAPATTTSLYLFPLPIEYERALHKKLTMSSEMRSKFRQASLSKDREFELNNTIQAYFKEWLSNSSMLRQIYDLSNLERDRDENVSPNDGSSAPATTVSNSTKDNVTLSL